MAGRIASCLLIGVIVVIAAPAWAAAAEPAAPAHRALLIGVNEYKAEKIPDLRGAVNDVERMRSVIKRFGFDDANIEVLTDKAADRDGILDALRGLVERTGPNDIVYIHYSGHGSQVKDENGDESDGYDETLVPHDGRQRNVPDITDDELDAILAGLRTRQTLVVLDSCHSGTGTRNLHLITRSIPRDDRVSLYRRDDTLQPRGTVEVARTNHVLMTGAPAHKSALDGKVDGAYRGIFSYALSLVLEDAAETISPENIYAGVQQQYQRIREELGGHPLPDPQVEANVQSLAAALFPQPLGAGQAPQKSFALARLIGRDEVLLRDAALHGATRGTFWAIYPPAETRFEHGGALATTRLDEIRGRDGIGRPDPADVRIPDDSRAIRISAPPPPGEIPIQIHAYSGAPADIRQQVLKAIRARLSYVRVAGEHEFARFIIDIERGRCRDCPPEIAISGAAGLVELERVPWHGPNTDLARLSSRMSRSYSAAAIKSLINPASRLGLEVSVITAPPADPRGVKITPSHQTGRYRFMRPGDSRTHINSLMLEIIAAGDYYLTIVDLDSAGGITMLFPNEYTRPDFYPGGLIPGGRRVRIPDSLSQGNAAGFHWDYGEPAGMDTIQVFASTTTAIRDRIRRYVAAAQADLGAQTEVGTRGAGALSDLRAELAQPEVFERGVHNVPSDPVATPVAAPVKQQAYDDWTAVSVNIVVEP